MFQVGSSVLLNLIFVGISLLLNLGSQLVLLDFYLFLRENLLAFGLFNLGLDSLDVDGLLLFLLLNGISGIGIGLSRIGLTLQGSTFQGQVVVFDGNGGIGINAGVVGILVGMGYLNLHITLGISTIDAGILLDLGSIIGTQVMDKSLLICNILNVTRDDFNTQLCHIGRGLHHHLI